MDKESPQQAYDLSLGTSPQLTMSPPAPQDEDYMTAFTHPLFKHEKDPLLSLIINVAKCLITKSSESGFKTFSSRWLGLLIKTVFVNTKLPSLKQELKGLGLSFDTNCGKMIGNTEVYFRCLDCDKFKDGSSTMYALLCSQCFESSNHENHRVIMVKKEPNCSATCDCGDQTALEPNGFCVNHTPKDFCVQETLLKFPSDFLERCLSVLKAAFYAVISLYEISFAIQDEKIKHTLSVLAQAALEATLTFCGICYNEINEAFLIVFGELFKSNFLHEKNLVWHFCEDTIASKGVKGIDSTLVHPCTCSIAANLLRIGNLPNHEAQIKLQRVLIECAKEPSFKTFLAQEFTKYIHFLYSETLTGNHPEDVFNSKLLDMKVQLYGTEDLCLKVLEGNHFNNLIQALKRVILHSKNITQEVYHIASDIRSSLVSFTNSQSKVGLSVIKDYSLLNHLLQILVSFQTKTYYSEQFHIGLFDHQIDYNSINTGLMCEKVISQVLEQGLKIVSTNLNEQKDLLHHLATEWYTCFENVTLANESKIKEAVSSFHPAIERSLIFFIKTLNNELAADSILKFFTLALPQVEICKLSERVIQGSLRSLGMIRYIHLEHNYNSGKIWNVYYFTNNLFFEMDVLTIQLMLAMMDPKHLFEHILENFLSYNQDLQTFFKNPNTLLQNDDRFKQKMLVLEDFLHFLIFIMNDETCSFNIRISKILESASKTVELCPRDFEVMRKVLINVLSGHFWIGVPEVKKIVKELLVNHNDIDKALQKVAIFDEKNKKVRIREEYKNEFDPYIFYRNPSLQSIINQNMSSKVEKGQQIDMISGKHYSGLPLTLKKIQQNIFKSSLPSYLVLFVGSFPSHTASLLRPVLKLILSNLQFCEEGKDSNETEELLIVIQANYLNKAFLDKLKQLCQISEFADCEPCIRQILKRLEDLSRKLENPANLLSDDKELSTKEDQNALKKKLAQERMLKLKEEFAKKQKTFADKNFIPQTMSPEKTGGIRLNEDNFQDNKIELRCQYCLDAIDPNMDIYGIPAYVSLTNNMYTVEKKDSSFIKEENPERLQGQWWPVFSSCMHHYHEKCFQKHHKNTRKSPDTLAKLFGNGLETYCSLCNSVCNIFFRENKDQQKQIPDQEGQDQELETYSFTENLTCIFEDFREKLRLYPNRDSKKEPSIPLTEIFKRGYLYLLEALHFIDKPSNLEKKYLLQKLFIEECLSGIGQTPESNENIVSIIEKDLLLSDKSIDEKLASFINSDLEAHLFDKVFQFLFMHSKQKTDVSHCDAINEYCKILKEYIPTKMIQFLLFQGSPDHFTIQNILSFYQTNKQMRSDFLKALEFPLKKFVLAVFINSTVLYRQENLKSQIFNGLLDSNEGVDISIENLFKAIGCSESLEELILRSLQSLNTQSENVITHLNALFLYKTAHIIPIERPLTLKLAPKMITLPKTYRDFTTKYLKQKCRQCQEYNQQMATYICLICGELICLGYCETLQHRKGNLNAHAKQYHLGSSIYLEIQKFTKATVAFSKNSLSEGKNLYTDQLGQSLQDLIKDSRYPLYSLDFDKFTLNEDSVQNTMLIIQQSDMPREAYRSTKASGYYYVEGNF